MRWPWQHDCRKCHDKGYVVVKDIIPRSEWTAQMLGDYILDGGYFFDRREVPCECAKETAK